MQIQKHTYTDDEGTQRELTVIPWELLADYPLESHNPSGPILGQDAASLIGDLVVFWDEDAGPKLAERLHDVNDTLVRRCGRSVKSLSRKANDDK